MSSSYKGGSEPYKSCGREDETTKKGLCFLELRSNGMVQWGVCRQVASLDGHVENLSSIVKEEQEEDELATVEASHVSSRIQKGKRLNLSQHSESGATKYLKQCSSRRIKQEYSIPCRKGNFIDRWSIERYMLAEKHMFEVMKAEGAVFNSPISRSVLRVAARKHIPDTGLLDHLLKHIDGKVAPGGTERFRRCYNTEGRMEYWLESVDQAKIKYKDGESDPNWVPSSWWKPSSVAISENVSTEESRVLKEEVVKLKRDMAELLSKNQEQNRVDRVEEMLKELMGWRSKTDQHLMEISSSVSSIQDMYQELMLWKAKTELQLTEISNSLNGVRTSTQCITFSPISERWEDWLESDNLDSVQGDDFAPFLGSTDLVPIGQEILTQECSIPQPWLKAYDSPSQEPTCARELELLEEEKVRRDLHDLQPRRVEDAQASGTPDSSITITNSLKFDLDSPFLLFQEMLKDLVKWKAKMEEQVLEISNSVSNFQAKQFST